MLINKHAVADFMDRELDDFRWMKKLPSEAILKELNQFKVKPHFKTQCWQHQLVCFYIGLCNPRFLFLLDMGLGKTKILTDLMTQYQREKRLNKALITMPRLINIDSWQEDLPRHSELEPWSCGVQDVEEKWDRLAYPKGDVSLIDYQGLHWALCDKVKAKGKKFKLERNDKKIKHIQGLYNFIGIDESHKLSSYDNLWFGIMRQITKTADFVYASTGTLFGKDPQDLWSQFYLVDRGETFGQNLGLFRAGLFTTKMNPWKGAEYIFNPKMHRKLNRMLQHRSIRYDEDEVLDLPQRVSRTHTFEMGQEQREHYLRALEGLINADGKLSELDASWLRMRQITSGYLAWSDGHGDHVIRFKHNPKLDGLERLIDEMGDSKIVICYDYTETGSMICDRLKSMKIDHEWYYGGTKDKSGSRRRFMDDPKCRVFVMNSEAGGTGNDGLQKVARYMVFYETPTSPTTRKQTIKRIHRPGQTERSFIYDLVMRKSLEKGILEDIAAGVDTHDKVVNGQAVNKSFFLRD